MLNFAVFRSVFEEGGVRTFPAQAPEKRAPEGGQRPATTQGLPSLAALGLAGGDGTEPADPLSCPARSASGTASSAGCAPPLTRLLGPVG